MRDQGRRACRNRANTRRINRKIPITANAVSPTSGLLHKGYIKAGNFKNSKNKRAYLYQLTPVGIAAKSKATKHFLARKQAEYERLAQEIKQLRQEVQAHESA